MFTISKIFGQIMYTKYECCAKMLHKGLVHEKQLLYQLNADDLLGREQNVQSKTILR
jgi:hypothetical protein